MSYNRANGLGAPVEIAAKFDGHCNETGSDIKKGSKCLYFPTERKIYTLTSQKAQRAKEAAQDQEFFDTMRIDKGWFGLSEYPVIKG